MLVRVMRGQVVIREEACSGGAIIIPSWGDERHRAEQRKTHIGVVLAAGAPMVGKGGAEVPMGFRVGDRVVFHWEHLERAWTREWVDGLPAAWVPQWCVDGVIERE